MAVGLPGAVRGLLLAEGKKRIIVLGEIGWKRVIEGSYMGKIVSVNTEVLKILLNIGYVVVVAPLATDGEGTLLNVDGDQAAWR